MIMHLYGQRATCISPRRYAPASLKRLTMYSLDIEKCVMANPVSGGWNRSMFIRIRILAEVEEIAPTRIGSVEKVGDFRYILESFVVNVAFLLELAGIFTCQLERRIAAQSTAPVIEQNREGKFPLFNLSVYNIVHLVLDQLYELALPRKPHKLTHCSVFRFDVIMRAVVNVFEIPEDYVESQE
jgi:hypothetical protein